MKRFTSLCIALTLLIVVLSISPAFSAVEKNPTIEPLQESYDNDLNKLHFYFGLESSEDKTGSALARTVSNEVSVDDDYFTYIDTENELDSAIENMNSYCDKYVEDDELIQVTVEFKSDFEKTPEYIEFQEKKGNVKTIEEVRELRKKLVEFSSEYHRLQNELNLKKLSDFGYENISPHELSPFISMEINENNIVADDFLSLAKDDSIVNVSFHLKEEFIDEEASSWNQTMRAIDAYSTVQYGSYTGEGINIGVLENGVCDITHTNFSDFISSDSNNRLTIDENCYNSDMFASEDYPVQVTSHATAVTSIIALMAPDSKIFVSSNRLKNFAGITWLINQGCDVINCSFGAPVSSGSDEQGYTVDPTKLEYQYHYDGKFDYLSKAHSVTIVKSAGNVTTNNSTSAYNPNGYVTTPGLAHNVITVGGLECDWGIFSCTLEYDPSACYRTVGSAAKPEISAVYSLKVPNIDGVCSGTSFAAPQVTGTIALIMCKYVQNALNPTAIKAMLISGAKQTDDHSNMSNTFFDDRIGAGCVNLENMKDSECIIYMGSNNSSSLVNNFVYSYDISLRKNDVLQNSVSWFAHFDDTNNTLDASDFNIMVYNSSGNLVASSSLGEFNTSEFIRYKAPSAGTYTIKVYQNGTLAEGIVSEPFTFVCNIL